MPEQNTIALTEQQSKKTWLDTLFELAIAFRGASLASGGSTAITGSNSDSISTSEVFLNQASLAVFFGGVIFLLVSISLCFDCCTGKAKRDGFAYTLAHKVSGKKRQVVLSALFSFAGGIAMFTQVDSTYSDRNKYVLSFSVLSQLFSGVLIGTDAAKLPGRMGQFFQERTQSSQPDDITASSVMREPYAVNPSDSMDSLHQSPLRETGGHANEPDAELVPS